MAPLLALAASVCYGVSNFIGPTLSRGAPTYVVLIAGQAVAFLVSGAVLLATATGLPGGAVAAAGLATGVGNAWGLIAFYRAASLGPLSIVAPIGATATVIPVVVGIAGGEPLDAVKLAGILLAIGGVVLAAGRWGEPRAAQAGDARAAAAWAVASTLGFGTFLTLIRPASEDGIFWAVLVSRASLLVVMAVAALLLREALRAPARTLPKLALPGMLLFAGTVAYAASTQLGDLSVVSVLGSLFPVVTVTLAFAFLGERLSRPQSVGVACALLGVVLLSVR